MQLPYLSNSTKLASTQKTNCLSACIRHVHAPPNILSLYIFFSNFYPLKFKFNIKFGCPTQPNSIHLNLNFTWIGNLGYCFGIILHRIERPFRNCIAWDPPLETATQTTLPFSLAIQQVAPHLVTTLTPTFKSCAMWNPPSEMEVV